MMKRKLLILILAISFTEALVAQDSVSVDSTKVYATQDAVYNRPFINNAKRSTAIGGYLEANTNYFVTDGITEGFSMEMRRFNIFLYSAIGNRIRFLSELEFEHGTEEIALETAMLDFKFNPALNFRGGIILAPIGGFNQNHDSPQWDFVERPLVSTEIIPSTLSEVGFGFNGKFYKSQWVLTYDAYVVNGLRDEIILNNDGRTLMQNGKSNKMFAEDNNGRPMYTGKIAVRHRKVGELGLSFYGGTYNSFKLEGDEVEEKRNMWIYAADYSVTIGKALIRGEAAYSTIQVPTDLSELFGTKQWGAYSEINYPIMKRDLFKFKGSILNANFRAEMVDYNVGRFSSTDQTKGDDIKALVVGLSLRPTTATSIRVNYRYHWSTDLLGNPPAKTAGFQFGLTTYF